MIVHVIHDPNRHDRKVLIDSQIKEHGLAVQFWPSIVDPLRTFRGINLAHKQIVRWAREERLPMVCIAEDDLKITGKGCWDLFLKNIPSDFDLYLSGIYCGKIEADNTVIDFCGLHLYIVHERFYDCYLGVDEMTNIDRGMANRGRYVVSNPFCAIQYDGWSDNKRRYASYGHILPSVLRGRKLCCESDTL